MKEFSLRDNLDSNDLAEFVVVRSDYEYGRWYRRNDAEDHARRIASEQLMQGRDALVEGVLDHPGDSSHGDIVFWIEVTTGDNA